MRSVVPRNPTEPLAVVLRRSTADPLSVQLARQVRDLAMTGAVGSGTRLPSSRALAAELHVARSVVEQAYDQLQAEGWLRSVRGAGTFVADLPASHVAPTESASPHRRLRPGRDLTSLDTGTPWQDPRVDPGWRRAWRQVSISKPPKGYPDPAGLAELRQEVSAYLARRRGVRRAPEEIVITSGTTHGWALLLDTVGKGGRVAIEDPGYRAAVAVAADAGFPVCDIPVDAAGLDVTALSRLEQDDVRAIYVTPAHQHPLGVTMSAGRRVALVAEAARRSAYIVEDDYDSEFRYDVAPLPALASLDRHRVVYLGTVSKVLHPGVRLGWLAADRDLVSRVVSRRAARHDHPSWPAQVAILTMMREGHLDRVIRTARRLYAERTSLVVSHLEEALGYEIAAWAGMYVAVEMPEAVARRASAAARAAGFDLPSLADYCRTSDRHGVVLGFGGVSDAELRRVLEAVAGGVRHGESSRGLA